MVILKWKRLTSCKDGRGIFSELLNEENQYGLEDHIKVEGPILGVTDKEVEGALQKMKRGKALGPAGVTMDLLKYSKPPIIRN